MWLAPLDGVLNIWLAPRDDPEAARVLTEDTGRGIRSCFWTHNKEFILSLRDEAGDENWHLYAVELATGKTTDLTPYDGVMAQFKKCLPQFPDEIIVGLNHRNPQWHDIYRINIVTGKRTLLLEHERYYDVVVDNDMRLRLAVELTADGGATFYQMLDGKWQHWATLPAADFYTTSIVGFDKTNEILYIRDSRGRNTSALVAIDLVKNEKHLLAADSQADITGVIRHPTERHVQAVSFVYQRARWQNPRQLHRGRLCIFTKREGW